MDINVTKVRLKDAIKKRDAYFTIALASLLVNVVLALGMLFHHPVDRITIVPAGFKQSFWIDKNGVSSSYLAEMTRYFATLKLNMTSESSDYQISQILKYTNPRTYGVLKANLIKETDKLKNEGLTSVFYPVNVQVDVSNLKATITGDLSYFVGKQETNTYRVSYVAKYSYDSNRLYLDSFEEVQKNG